MNNYILVFTVAILFIIGIWGITFLSGEINKIEAQKIIDFRETEQSCEDLSKLYFKYYPIRYNSSNDLRWYWEVKDKLYENNCITDEDLQNIEFIEVCMDGGTTGCEISKLENPELYENFNFKSAIKESIKQHKELDQ